ncbi:hypothetical protein SLEP1_g9181 [Rubroshorea leprosula]|uniref:Uncharacterized protein n=1 Tax=Rubroshorea leprosula TaxID=152421 RepID=A0AAV5I9S5_9ROSI|nr:hypothetical protein SLEP1_g9181 [Rubroshorea leprosula]
MMYSCTPPLPSPDLHSSPPCTPRPAPITPPAHRTLPPILRLTLQSTEDGTDACKMTVLRGQFWPHSIHSRKKEDKSEG